MQAITLTIGDRQFRLRVATDLTQFSARLTDAVRAGGGMVEIPVATEGGVTVLVSPGVSVVLETHEVDFEHLRDEATGVPWVAGDDMEF